MLGLCWPFWGLCWGHLGPKLVPCSPILGLCWGSVYPPEVILELCCVHDFTFIPKFCLKKLSPVACEATTPLVQRHFSEKAESCLGGAHPRCAAEGSRQWPARCQETLPKGSKFAHLEQCWGYGKRHSLILSPKPCSCLGRALQKCLLNRSMLAYLGAMLGLCWPIWGLCWGHVRPSWGYVGALLTLRR